MKALITHVAPIVAVVPVDTDNIFSDIPSSVLFSEFPGNIVTSHAYSPLLPSQTDKA